jgi:hypothetical protein
MRCAAESAQQAEQPARRWWGWQRSWYEATGCPRLMSTSVSSSDANGRPQ